MIRLSNVLVNHVSTCLRDLQVMEHMVNGSVRDNLDKEHCPLDYLTKLQIAEQTAGGLHYLSSRSPPVFHRDIKSDNVLLDSHYNAKVADFGLATTMDTARSTSQTVAGAFVGSMAFSAPEYLCGEIKTYTLACDVYSFGIFLWELVTHSLPWVGVPAMQLPAIVGMHKRRPEIVEGVPAALAALIVSCWDHDPKARPDFARISAELSAQVRAEAEMATPRQPSHWPMTSAA